MSLLCGLSVHLFGTGRSIRVKSGTCGSLSAQVELCNIGQFPHLIRSTCYANQEETCLFGHHCIVNEARQVSLRWLNTYSLCFSWLLTTISLSIFLSRSKSCPLICCTMQMGEQHKNEVKATSYDFKEKSGMKLRLMQIYIFFHKTQLFSILNVLLNPVNSLFRLLLFLLHSLLFLP